MDGKRTIDRCMDEGIPRTGKFPSVNTQGNVGYSVGDAQSVTQVTLLTLMLVSKSGFCSVYHLAVLE